MPEELSVHIGRESVHEVDVPDAFEASGPFDVRVINHGNSLHVHLHLDDALSEVAAIDAGNHYVEGDSERAVRVDVDPDRIGDRVFGKLKVVSAYGAETRYVDVTLLREAETTESVTVDESLRRPQPRADPGPSGLRDRPEALVGALAVIALTVAVVTAILLGSPLVLVGAVIVAAGVGVAALLLVE